LLEEDNFKDWVGDAKRNVPVPVLSVPDTPVADVEIRLVEPTPVPSRVGSLGGSLAASGLLTIAAVPPKLSEEGEMEETNEELEDGMPVASSSKAQSKSRPRSPRKKGKFFVHSSPSKGSGSDSPHPSPTIPSETAQTHPTLPQPPRRQSSGSSSGGVMMKLKKGKEKEERNLSLSTMKGKFASEKRKMARALAAAKEDEEGSGWEDEVEEQGAAEGDEAWSDEPDSPKKPKREKRRSSSRSRSGRSSSNLELTHLLTRQRSNRTPPKDVPPPPAPTPLRRMSKKERQAAAAERAKIETELEARTKRQMFAKKQIFGGRLAGEGLLSQVLKSGGSMVDLVRITLAKISCTAELTRPKRKMAVDQRSAHLQLTVICLHLVVHLLLDRAYYEASRPWRCRCSLALALPSGLMEQTT